MRVCLPLLLGLVVVSPALASTAQGSGSPAIGDATPYLLIGILLVAAVASVGIMRRIGILARNAFIPPRRAPEQLGWGLWAIGALLLFFVMPIGVSIALTLSGDLEHFKPGSMTLRAMAVATIGMSVAGGGAGIALLVIISRKVPDLGFRFNPKDPLWGLASFLAAIPILLLINTSATAIDTLINGPAPDPIAHETLRLMSGSPGSTWWWVTVAGVVIGAPIAEELLYRGFLQSSLVALTRSRWLAILITSVLFAFAHDGIADWRALPGLFALSIALGIAFERKGRIGVPIMVHALFNAFNVGLSLYSIR
jgi:membrane protease YdiL (CAAX protease family)